MTVNNPVDLRVSRSLELLTGLKETATKFAKREDQLNRELQTRRYNTTRQNNEELEKAEAAHAAQVAQAEAFFQAEAVRVKAKYENRRLRVGRVHIAKLKNLPKLAQATRTKWLNDLQVRNSIAQKKHAAEMAAAEAAAGGFITKLGEYRAAQLEREKKARNIFSGYWSLCGMLPKKSSKPAALNPEAEVGTPYEQLDALAKTAEENLDAFQKHLIPKFFRYVQLPVLLVLTLLVVGASWYLGTHPGVLKANHLDNLIPIEIDPTVCAITGGSTALLFFVLWIVHTIGFGQVKPVAKPVALALRESRRLIEEGYASGPARQAVFEESRQRIQEEFDRTVAEIQVQWGRADEIERAFEQKIRQRMDAQVPRLIEKITSLVGPKLEHLEARRVEWLEQAHAYARYQQKDLIETRDRTAAMLDAENKVHWEQIETDWKQEMVPLYQGLDAMNAEAAARFPEWNDSILETWKPTNEFTPATKFARLDLDLSKSALPKDPRLALPGPAQVTAPVALTFPYNGSLLFETNESGGELMLGALNNIVMRLLCTTPPGKASFTIIDPVGLGQSFAGFMYLADYEEAIINRRIWTQRDQIEERLAELSDHIEKVIQMYLRTEYATITEYNEKAGSVAEKYHFLLVADFPTNFSDIAAKRLQSIAMSGPRCGIFTLLHWDQRQVLPDGFLPDETRKASICLHRSGREFTLGRRQTDIGATLTIDPPPNADLGVNLVHKIGKASIDSNRVQVPFQQVAPPPEEMWTNETASELRVAVGRTGATKLQYMAIGKGTRQHALFAGKTGSGKSTLFHVIITNLALSCSPEQVEFYLIDFKKGVEFKCYAARHLPHARVIAIESDREFALSVLQRVDAELKRRGDMFRKLGVQDVAGYKRAGGTEPMPRSLLLIDEFQEFFVDDDPIAQGASLLFDRIVRQGRAFGIHVLLGSQTLGGAYALARATIGQMVIRVALQCNEADAYLIMDENNSAPRLLTRPGEGIYNDAAGAIEGNSPFQVVWLPDEERDHWLDKVQSLVDSHPEIRYSRPIVFEGNSPSDIRDNELLQAAFNQPAVRRPEAARAWLGAPNSIKGPTEAVFKRQSGNHLLIVGQREEATINMLGIAMLSLAAQFPKGTAKFVLFHAAAPGTSEADFMDKIVRTIPHEVVIVRGQDVAPAVNDLATEVKTRAADEATAHGLPTTFLFIHGLHKFKKLRAEDDFSFSMSSDSGPATGAQFAEIITDGSSQGIHIITTIDTLNNVNRFMNRKALTNFEMRVVYQMSANDSASLIDSPKASNLGLHRSLFYNEQEGTLETFRPYAAPDPEWLEQVATRVASPPATAVEDAVLVT